MQLASVSHDNEGRPATKEPGEEPLPTSAMLYQASLRESIEICRPHAEMLANMARIDEAVEDICNRICEHYGHQTEGVDRIVKAHSELFDTIKREVADVLFSTLFDHKNATNM